MAEELQQAAVTEDVQGRQRQKVKETKEVTCESAIGRLAKFGGFSFLESRVDGIQNLNPEHKSRKKIFNGDNLGLQTYSVVRVFDYIAKVLIDFLNRRAFENWNTKTEKDLRIQITCTYSSFLY